MVESSSPPAVNKVLLGSDVLSMAIPGLQQQIGQDTAETIWPLTEKLPTPALPQCFWNFNEQTSHPGSP